MSNDDMMTMPVRELIAGMREKTSSPDAEKSMSVIVILVLNVLINRLEQEADDADRYRHMRGNAAFQDRNGPGVYWYLPRWDRDLPVGERLDKAIDDAIKAEAGDETA